MRVCVYGTCGEQQEADETKTRCSAHRKYKLSLNRHGAVNADIGECSSYMVLWCVCVIPCTKVKPLKLAFTGKRFILDCMRLHKHSSCDVLSAPMKMSSLQNIQLHFMCAFCCSSLSRAGRGWKAPEGKGKKGDGGGSYVVDTPLCGVLWWSSAHMCT